MSRRFPDFRRIGFFKLFNTIPFLGIKKSLKSFFLIKSEKKVEYFFIFSQKTIEILDKYLTFEYLYARLQRINIF